MVIFIGGLLATLGAALQGGAVTVAMLIAGRFIAGWAIGLMSATIPVYCVCPPHLALALVVCNALTNSQQRARLRRHAFEAYLPVCSSG